MPDGERWAEVDDTERGYRTIEQIAQETIATHERGETCDSCIDGRCLTWEWATYVVTRTPQLP